MSEAPTKKAILAVGPNNEFSYKGGLPWHKNPEDLALFFNLTKGTDLIMGRKTYESIPFAPGSAGRRFVVISRNHKVSAGDHNLMFRGLEDVSFATARTELPVSIIGGKDIFESEIMDSIDEVHISVMNRTKILGCDKTLDLDRVLGNRKAIQEQDYETFTHIVYGR